MIISMAEGAAASISDEPHVFFLGSRREGNRGLTGHSVPFGRREGRGVHVDDASGGEIVVFLGSEVKVPVFGIVGEEREAVELAVCCDEFGDEVGI